ncbi:hypothetical protein VTK56DRAFT_4018 [Thermocarpiscus australiensis]
MRGTYGPGIAALARVYADTIFHSPTGIGNKNYAVHIVDQYSGYHWYMAITDKSQGFKVLTDWIIFVENQTGVTVQEIHIDNGTEFHLTELQAWCRKLGKKLTTTVPDCPEQNGPAERAGQTIMNGARTANLEAGFGENFWPFAEEAYIHVLNRLPRDGEDKSPMELFGESVGLPTDQCVPDIRHLRAYGARAFVHINNENVRPRGRKMLAKALEGKLCGYEGNTGKVYRIRLNSGRIVRARDARFIEEFDGDDTPGDEPIYEATFDDVYYQPHGWRAAVHLDHQVLVSNNLPDEEDNSSQQTLPSNRQIDTRKVHFTDEQNEQGQNQLPTPSPDRAPSQGHQYQYGESDDELVERTDTIFSNNEDDDADELTARTRRSRRANRPPGYYKALHNNGKEAADKLFSGVFADIDHFEPEQQEVILTALDNQDLFAPTQSNAPYLPKTFKEAYKRPDFDTHWRPACQEQVDKLTKQGTWVLVDRKPGMKVLPGKWVLDQKFDASGQWLRNRARWVVCGNFENGDYAPHEVYSAVVHASSVRIFFNLVATLGLKCYQSDIVGAHLHANIPDGVEVYVQQPTGFTDGTDKVCLLRKALYGLQRSALWWYNTLVPELKKLGFEPLTKDGCVFKHAEKGALLLLYVDDLNLAAATTEDIATVEEALGNIFELKRLGETKTFLGYNIVRDCDNNTIYLHQERYVNKTLERFGKANLNPVRCPWPPKFTLPKTWEVVDAATKAYQEECGSLNYLAVCTRPDISYTIMRIGEVNAGPSQAHLDLLQHLWRYVVGTKSLGLRCGGKHNINNLQLRAFGDASFATDLLTRTSVGGHVVMIGGCPVVWKSKKQALVTLSTTEAEFIKLTPTALSLLWVANVLKEAGYEQPMPLILFTDSANARSTCLSPLNTARTYHIDVRYKWVIQRLAMGQFHLEHVCTDRMVADGLTKGLSRIKHEQFVRLLGLSVPPQQL